MSPVFRHGRLRLYLLKLLDEAPRHGYEVIRLLQDRFMGIYAPSPGTIYPRLARLEEEGLVTHDEADGRKVYRITDKGREELHARLDDLTELEEEITASVRDIAREVTEDVRETVRTLREELSWAAREFHARAHQRRRRRPRRSSRHAGTDEARARAEATRARSRQRGYGKPREQAARAREAAARHATSASDRGPDAREAAAKHEQARAGRGGRGAGHGRRQADRATTTPHAPGHEAARAGDQAARTRTTAPSRGCGTGRATRRAAGGTSGAEAPRRRGRRDLPGDREQPGARSARRHGDDGARGPYRRHRGRTGHRRRGRDRHEEAHGTSGRRGEREWGEWAGWTGWGGWPGAAGHHGWADPDAYRDLERLAKQFSRELRSAAWHAQAVSEDALRDLRGILDETIDRIKDEVFKGKAPGQPGDPDDSPRRRP